MGLPWKVGTPGTAVVDDAGKVVAFTTNLVQAALIVEAVNAAARWKAADEAGSAVLHYEQS